MKEQLNNLFDLYKTSSNKFKSETDESNVLEFNDKIHDDLLLSLSLNKIDNLYYIFLYIEKESKIIFKGLIDYSTNNLKNLYSEILNDLSSVNLESFISKYYTNLEKNFL